MSPKAAIRIGFAGDLMLGGEALTHASRRSLDVTYAFKALIPTFCELDILFVNLEGPLLQNKAAALKKPLLLSNDPAVVEVLKLPKNCVCSLANNHSFDYGADALLKTQRLFDKHGICHLGAGRNAAEAQRELILESGGWRIGCLAFTATGPGLQPVIARNGNPGCASLPETRALSERVRRLRTEVDFVIVMLHWGREFYEYPTPAQVRLARALVDAGAHVIAGHHPHAIQPIEEYKGALIAYSLGHLFMPPFRLPNNGPVFYPRAASKEFLLMRLELPAEFPHSAGAVNVVAGGLDAHFRLRPYNRIALQSFRSRLEDLGCPLRNGHYGEFWRQYRAWRQAQLESLLPYPSREEDSL